MKTKIKLIITFIPTVLIAALVIGINEIDPFYKTNKSISVEIIKRISAVGKTGSRVEITLRSKDGKEYWYSMASTYGGMPGDRVKLHIYERQRTGLQKYELEY